MRFPAKFTTQNGFTVRVRILSWSRLQHFSFQPLEQVIQRDLRSNDRLNPGVRRLAHHHLDRAEVRRVVGRIVRDQATRHSVGGEHDPGLQQF